MLGRGSNLIVPDEGVEGLVISLAQKSLVGFRDPARRPGPGRGGPSPEEPLRPGRRGRPFRLRVSGGHPRKRRRGAPDERRRHGRVDFRHRGRGEDDGDGRGGRAPCPRTSMGVDYRHCGELKDAIALGAVLRPMARVGSATAVGRQIDDYRRKRHESQPREPSAGCIFKNPPGASAGRLIEESGLKGTRVGGGRGLARACEFCHQPWRRDQRRRAGADPPGAGGVRQAKGVELEPEVLLYGKEWRDVAVSEPVIAVFAGGTSAETRGVGRIGTRLRAGPRPVLHDPPVRHHGRRAARGL